MYTRQRRDIRSDNGSALILVLVLMVVGALIVLPLMDYAMSVGRANSVLTTKTKRTEAVRAGLRIALATPTQVYDTCDDSGDHPLPVSGLEVQVTTVCRLISTSTALDDTEKRLGLAAVQVGETVPPILLATGTSEPPPVAYAPPAGPESAWQNDATSTSTTDKLFLPNLPVHSVSPRTSEGWMMPDPVPLPVGYLGCKVYFPGTYTSAINISGPTFFTSGIYYFENTVSITNGADVVVGAGLLNGCTNDQDAAYQAIGGPREHHVNALGATFVFGGAGRLVVDNAGTGPIKLRFNYRYAVGGDLGGAPSAGVSIVSVNGALDTDGTTGIPLLITGELAVPLSLVGTTPVLPLTAPAATTQKYLPSTLVPPTVTAPDQPTITTTAANNGAVRVTWNPPVNTGHSQITGYKVKVLTGTPNAPFCTTITNTCVVLGLTNATPYTFTVEATNADLLTSVPSAPSLAVTPTVASPAPIVVADPPFVALPPETALPIVDLNLVGSEPVEIYVPGHISIPQGRFKVSNAGSPAGLAVKIEGGVLAASFDVVDNRPAPLPIGFVNAVTQRKIQIVTATTPGSGAPHVVSTAVVQINQSGPWEINSWVVQLS